MGKNNNVIELNGKRYDAVTGQMLGHSHVSSALAPTRKKHSAGVIDGVLHHKPTASAAAKQKVATSAQKPSNAASSLSISGSKAHSISDITTTKPALKRAKARSITPRQPSHAKTLMRHAVKKPAHSFKRSLKVQTRTDILAKIPALEVAPKLSFSSVDSARLARAKRIAKNRLISRFGTMETTFFSKPAPSHSSLPTPTHSSYHTAQPITAKKPTPPHHQTTKRTYDIFEKAIEHATSHEQTYKHTKKHNLKKGRIAKRIMKVTTATMAVVLLGGFIAYQNKTNIALHVASSRAGFQASLPGWKPSGFAMGNLNYSPGIVAVNFKSQNDSRQFNLTERTSKWDSATLLNELLAANVQSYQTVKAAGRTIYVYDKNNASWVDNGVQYVIKSNDSLSTDQVIHIASSI